MSKPEKIIECYQVINVKGLHARAAAQIVEISSHFECQITLSHKSKSASSLSLIKLLTLDAPQGSKIEVSAQGKDAIKALRAIKQLFLSGFGELDI